MKKLLGILVIGLCGMTCNRLVTREIKKYTFINEKTYRDRGSGFVVVWQC